MLKTLFLNPPSFEGFDGGAGSRYQARREVRRRHAEVRAREAVNLLRKPQDGRVFLLANEVPDKLGRRFAFWSAVHLLIFFGAGLALLLFFA